MTPELPSIDHALLEGITGGYPSGFDPPEKEYRGDQWSDYVNPNAGKELPYDMKMDRGMWKQPDNGAMDQDLLKPAVGNSSGALDI